jgi:hypothetical protein
MTVTIQSAAFDASSLITFIWYDDVKEGLSSMTHRPGDDLSYIPGSATNGQAVLDQTKQQPQWTQYWATQQGVNLWLSKYDPPYVAPPVSSADVDAERDRRLALGFNYTFPPLANGSADPRGTIRIGTTPSDWSDGWDYVTRFVNAITNLETANEVTINIQPDSGGSVAITPIEWNMILAYAGVIGQSLWDAAGALQAMSPIPTNYTDDQYWGGVS